MKDLMKMTLAEQIYTILREDIINQSLKCGEKLTLKAIQERFGISSTPAREAMIRLNREGLLDHVTNIGAKVIDFQRKDIIEIYNMCSILDTAAVKLAMQGNRQESLEAELLQSIKLQEKALEAGNTADFIPLSNGFHYIFYKYAENSRLCNTMRNMDSQFCVLSNIYQNFTVAKPVMLAEHKDIAASVCEKNSVRAAQLMESHFAHGRDFLLENL